MSLISTPPDPFVRDWFLTNADSQILVPLLLLLYLALAFIILPMVKNSRHYDEAIGLRSYMTIHNVLLVLMNIFLGLSFLWNIYHAGYSCLCEPVKTSRFLDPEELNLKHLSWWYLISKVFEMSDIGFSIFRPNPLPFQVNSLVYHHGTMLVISWIAARYLPGGSTAIMSSINCCLHVIMYMYFACSGKNLNCGGGCLDARKFITFCTILQFSLIICHCITGIYLRCGYPPTAFLVVIILIVTYIMGFSFGPYFSNYTIGVQIYNGQNSEAKSDNSTSNLDRAEDVISDDETSTASDNSTVVTPPK